MDLRSPDPVVRPMRDVSYLGNPVMTLRAGEAEGVRARRDGDRDASRCGSVRFRRPDNSKDHGRRPLPSLWLKAPGIDVPLASGKTSAMGGFGATVTIPTTLGRTFYPFTITTENSWVHVLDDPEGEEPFTFTSDAFEGKVGGGDTSKGLIMSMYYGEGLHMLTTVTRGFRYLLDHTSYTFPDDIDDVDIDYPDSDWPHHTWPLRRDDLHSQRTGRGTAARCCEFGHHVNYELPIDMDKSSTDDGNCEPGSPGRHCLWCAGTISTSPLPEGFASFFSVGRA